MELTFELRLSLVAAALTLGLTLSNAALITKDPDLRQADSAVVPDGEDPLIFSAEIGVLVLLLVIGGGLVAAPAIYVLSARLAERQKAPFVLHATAVANGHMRNVMSPKVLDSISVDMINAVVEDPVDDKDQDFREILPAKVEERSEPKRPRRLTANVRLGPLTRCRDVDRFANQDFDTDGAPGVSQDLYPRITSLKDLDGSQAGLAARVVNPPANLVCLFAYDEKTPMAVRPSICTIVN